VEQVRGGWRGKFRFREFSAVAEGVEESATEDHRRREGAKRQEEEKKDEQGRQEAGSE
jgi:hypothetical protein